MPAVLGATEGILESIDNDPVLWRSVTVWEGEERSYYWFSEKISASSKSSEGLTVGTYAGHVEKMSVEWVYFS